MQIKQQDCPADRRWPLCQAILLSSSLYWHAVPRQFDITLHYLQRGSRHTCKIMAKWGDAPGTWTDPWLQGLITLLQYGGPAPGNSEKAIVYYQFNLGCHQACISENERLQSHLKLPPLSSSRAMTKPPHRPDTSCSLSVSSVTTPNTVPAPRITASSRALCVAFAVTCTRAKSIISRFD